MAKYFTIVKYLTQQENGKMPGEVESIPMAWLTQPGGKNEIVKFIYPDPSFFFSDAIAKFKTKATAEGTEFPAALSVDCEAQAIAVSSNFEKSQDKVKKFIREGLEILDTSEEEAGRLKRAPKRYSDFVVPAARDKSQKIRKQNPPLESPDLLGLNTNDIIPNSQAEDLAKDTADQASTGANDDELTQFDPELVEEQDDRDQIGNADVAEDADVQEVETDERPLECDPGQPIQILVRGPEQEGGDSALYTLLEQFKDEFNEFKVQLLNAYAEVKADQKITDGRLKKIEKRLDTIQAAMSAKKSTGKEVVIDDEFDLPVTGVDYSWEEFDVLEKKLKDHGTCCRLVRFLADISTGKQMGDMVLSVTNNLLDKCVQQMFVLKRLKKSEIWDPNVTKRVFIKTESYKVVRATIKALFTDRGSTYPGDEVMDDKLSTVFSNSRFPNGKSATKSTKPSASEKQTEKAEKEKGKKKSVETSEKIDTREKNLQDEGSKPENIAPGNGILPRSMLETFELSSDTEKSGSSYSPKPGDSYESE